MSTFKSEGAADNLSVYSHSERQKTVLHDKNGIWRNVFSFVAKVLKITTKPTLRLPRDRMCGCRFVPSNGFNTRIVTFRYGNLKTTDQLKKLKVELKPFVLRRLKETVEKSIPPKQETIIDIELTTLQKKYYRAIYEKNRKFLVQVHFWFSFVRSFFEKSAHLNFDFG